MRKYISFTLYGDNPKYVEGMHRNIEMKDEFYPDWDIIIFHDDSVAPEVLETLSQNAELRNMTDSGILAASWRFCVIDEPDVERFIVRDSDSRFSAREVAAVQQWEQEDTRLHIMRDHPHHGYVILGGMWGVKVDREFENANLRDILLYYQGGAVEDMTNREHWSMTDMNFLRDAVYPHSALEEGNSTIHAATDYMHKVSWQNEPWSKDFPTPRNADKNFVGEIFDFVDGEEVRGPQYAEL